MKRGLLGAFMLIVADSALASGIRPGDIAPIMIAPVFAACALGLLIGAALAKEREGATGWLVGGGVLVFTIALSRVLAGYGYLAAIIPQVIVGIALLLAWRK